MGTDIPLKELGQAVMQPASLVLLPHVDPDGDTLASCVALALALEKAGKKVRVLTENGIPRIYELLEKTGTLLHLNQTPGALDQQDACAVAVDAGSLERLGRRKILLLGAECSLNIDHHRTNTRFAQRNHVDIRASSTGEIICNLIHMLMIPLDPDIATALYIAISTDTGGFRFGNTTPETHRIAADLLKTGLTMEISELSRLLFERTTPAKTLLMGHTAGNIRFYGGGRIALSVITQQEMEEIGASDEDCEGLVNIGRNIQGVEVSVFMRQRPDDTVKVNLRSNEYIDVSAVSTRFAGGGHSRAAGFTWTGDTDKLIPLLVEQLEKELEKELEKGLGTEQ
ncbi:MAG TPA: bifunctional oligoribonuclease/PAP phosphatase NrnA [Clostridiales bacterium]|nr:bifunctional oligoribonuclease/PAP phosphatase NrnA [Clostridiales bacterium]